MIDEPTDIDLLEAMARTLTDDVIPNCAGGAQHSARVVANLCRILARERAADGRGLELLIDHTGHDAPLADLVAEVDAEIARTTDPDDLAAILEILLADTAHRAEIAKPGYTDHGQA